MEQLLFWNYQPIVCAVLIINKLNVLAELIFLVVVVYHALCCQLTHGYPCLSVVSNGLPPGLISESNAEVP